MKPQGRGTGAWGGLGHKEATCLQSEKKLITSSLNSKKCLKYEIPIHVK